MKLDAGHKHLWTSVTSRDARDQEWTDSIKQGRQHDLGPPQLVEQNSNESNPPFIPHILVWNWVSLNTHHSERYVAAQDIQLIHVFELFMGTEWSCDKTLGVSGQENQEGLTSDLLSLFLCTGGVEEE